MSCLLGKKIAFPDFFLKTIMLHGYQLDVSDVSTRALVVVSLSGLTVTLDNTAFEQF